MNAYGYLTIRRKTFAVGRKTVKIAKAFPLESFVVYGKLYHVFDLIYHLQCTSHCHDR